MINIVDSFQGAINIRNDRNIRALIEHERGLILVGQHKIKH